MTATAQLEAGCFRYYLERILALDSRLSDELKREIAAVLMICDAGADMQKLLAERDRRIRMQDIICKCAFERIATLEERLRSVEESVSWPDGQGDAVVRSQKGNCLNIGRKRLN
jgi:hypothetical protein